MRHSTIEKYRAILVAIYAAIEKGAPIDFEKPIAGQKVTLNTRTILYKGGFIDYTAKPDIYAWVYQFPNGVKDYIIASRKLIDYQNDRKREKRSKIAAQVIHNKNVRVAMPMTIKPINGAEPHEEEFEAPPF